MSSVQLWDELVAEFPPLWNPSDIHFRNSTIKNQCMEQLLEKCNRISKFPMTMELLRKQVRSVNSRRCRGASMVMNTETSPGPPANSANPTGYHPTTIYLSALPQVAMMPMINAGIEGHSGLAQQAGSQVEMPSSTNSTPSYPKRILEDQDLQGVSGMPQAQSESQTAFPTSTTPSIDPPMPGTRRKLEELVAEYPCLWDPQDPDYKDLVVRDQYMDQLLVKYNKLFSSSITFEQLQKKIHVMGPRLYKRKQKVIPVPFPYPDSPDEDSSESWVMSSDSNSDSSDTVDETENTHAWSTSNQIQHFKHVQNNANQFPHTNNVQNISNQPTGIFNLVVHCCCVCGEVKSDCTSATDKSYIKNNKTELAMNDLSIELNINKDANICQQCDTKLREMYDFVNLVKIAQDKMRHVNVLDEITMDEDENEDKKFVIDSVSVTDTQLLKSNAHKRKGLQENEQASEAKKQFKVTIDLNLNDKGNNMEDIGTKYRMFKKDESLTKSKNANEPKVTKGSEDFSLLDIKKEVETDDMSDNNVETGEVLAMDDIEAKYRIFQNKDVSLAKSIKCNEASKVTTTEDNTRKKVNESGGIVSEDDIRNDIVPEQRRDSVKTNKTSSVVDKLTSTAPLSVIPQSELVQLVESIVSRMLNK